MTKTRELRKEAMFISDKHIDDCECGRKVKKEFFSIPRKDSKRIDLFMGFCECGNMFISR